MNRGSTKELANEVRLVCQRVSRRVRYESSGDLAPHLVSALSKLRDGAITPSELAEAERVSGPSMTRTIGCLSDRGLVRSVDNPNDGRSKLLSLTPDGEAALAEIRRARDDWMDVRLHDLTREERDLLRRATELLRRVIEQ